MAALSRLEIEDQPFALYMLCKENGESFELTAFDGAESWAGKITKKQLKEMAGKVCFARACTFTILHDLFEYS